MLGFVLLMVVLATLLVVGYLLFIWWLDRYEREPLWVVGLTFVWGALGGTCLSCVVNSTTGSVLVASFGEGMGGALTTVVVAPVVEELMKGLVFAALILFGNQLDNKTDGLIYGAATGLGFACLENLWYYMNYFNPDAPESILPIIFLRTMFTALVHCISSATLGMAIGHARHGAGIGRWLIWPMLGYIGAVVCHGTWNLMATLTETFAKDQEMAALGGVTLLLAIALVLGASVVMFIMTQLSLNAEHKVIQRFLLEEAEHGVLPMEHAKIIPYWNRRRKKGWLAPHIPREPYVRAATLLAFRHYQLEASQGERQHHYREEIARYRKQVRDLLTTR